MRYRASRGYSLNVIWTLIGINVLVFLSVSMYRPLVSFFALTPAYFPERPWTILTSMFMHSGFWHILANMMTLYFFGNYLNNLVGTGRLLFVYFGGGILGNVLYILWGFSLGSPLIPVVGASGALFALGGALAAMRPRVKVFIIPIPVPLPLWIAVIGGFVILSFLPFVAWQAHLGGLIFGLVSGYFFGKQRHNFWL